MTDREKVIRGLECCQKKACIYKDTLKECPYWELCGEYEDAFEDCTRALAKDALALLKAQEPRVMTLEEVQLSCNALTLEKRHTVCYGLETVLLVAQLDYAEPPCEKFGVSGYEETQAFNDCDYGKTWRCWTSRPTDEQMEATPWDG